MERILHANGVITYTFSSLVQQPVQAHVSTRHGGVSPAPWNTLNFSVMRGDTPERVKENRARLAAALHIDNQRVVRCHQVHGTGVAKIEAQDAGTWPNDTDALVTDAVDVPLTLVFADCVPILLYDPHHHALGVCHAGWRGTVNGVATATLWTMQAAYDTNPLDVLVGIGPSIGPQSYQVGQEVVDLAYAKLHQAERCFTYADGPAQNPYFDLWQANLNQLVEGGVSAANIELSGIDTAQNTQDFFSHRAERGRCGLFSMTAWLEARRL